MMTPKTQTIMASTIIVLNISVSLALLPMNPEGSAVVLISMAALIVVWNVMKAIVKRKCNNWVESKVRHEILFAIILASLLILGSISATLAKELGIFDKDLVERIIGINIGLMLVVMGNYMPKKSTGSCSTDTDKCRKSRVMQRFVGWTLVISGMLYALVWLFVDLNKASLAVLFTFPAAIFIVICTRTIYQRTAGPKNITEQSV
jgi:hypothetical protein